jgi:uncharacterized membrane protein YhaH (DUF805 family)
LSWLSAILGVHGRINRVQYLVGVVACSIVAEVLTIWLMATVYGQPSQQGYLEGEEFDAARFLSGTITMPLLLSLGVRRAHDIGASGWIVLAALAAPFLGALPLLFGGRLMWLFALPAAVGTLLLIVALGKKGPNKYGKEPAPGLSGDWGS